MKNLNDLLKNIDPKTLEQGRRTAEAFSKTAEGKALLDKFSNTTFNAENLKNISGKDADAILSFIKENPDIKNKIEAIVKKE